MQPAQTEANNLRQILKEGHLNQNVLKLQDYGISYNYAYSALLDFHPPVSSAYSLRILPDFWGRRGSVFM